MALTATTLAIAVDAYANEIQVTSATNVVVGQPLRVDHEYLKVSSLDGTRIGVIRGVRGTKAQAHNKLAHTVTGPWADFPVEECPMPGSYTYDVSGALTVAPGLHKIVKDTAGAAMTLACPTRAQEGLVMSILALTTETSHTVTVAAADDAVGGFGGAGASFDVATFGTVGDSLTIMAAQGRWYVIGANSVGLT